MHDGHHHPSHGHSPHRACGHTHHEDAAPAATAFEHNHDEGEQVATAHDAVERQLRFVELQQKARADYIAQQGPIARALQDVRHKVAILSGKGGVGKTTATINLAVTLRVMGYSVVVFDADIHGPSVPKMLGAYGRTGVRPLHNFGPDTNEPADPPHGGHDAHWHGHDHTAQTQGHDGSGEPRVDHHSFLFEPVETKHGVSVISVASIWPGEETPVMWKGPHKMRAIRQFLSAAHWGRADFLLIDLPPGTGDEVQTIMTAIPGLDGMLVITTPQGVSRMVCSKAINCAKELGAPLLGLVENMGTMLCPHCGGHIQPFGKGKGERLARMMEIPYFGSVPFDPEVGYACDEGVPAVVADPDGPVAEAFRDVARRLLTSVGEPTRSPVPLEVER